MVTVTSKLIFINYSLGQKKIGERGFNNAAVLHDNRDHPEIRIFGSQFLKDLRGKATLGFFEFWAFPY